MAALVPIYCWNCGFQGLAYRRVNKGDIRYVRCLGCDRMFVFEYWPRPEMMNMGMVNRNETRFRQVFGTSPETVVLEIFLETPAADNDARNISDSTGLSFRESATILDNLFRYGILAAKRNRHGRTYILSKESAAAKAIFGLHEVLISSRKMEVPPCRRKGE